MAQVSFSIADLFYRQFGFEPEAFNPDFTSLPARKEYGQMGNGSPYYAKDSLGQEYFMPVSMDYQLPDGTTKTDYQLPYPVLSISAKKRLVETSLTARRGTVKELITTEDYNITIRGFAITQAEQYTTFKDGSGQRTQKISQTKDFPETLITDLRDIFETNTAITIKSPLTDIYLVRPDRKGSDKVVITALELPEIVGVTNVRPYVLHLTSDEPFDLTEI